MLDNIAKEDEIDRSFQELDLIVEIASKYRNEPGYKHYANLAQILLMAEEVDQTEIKEYQQEGGNWIVEIRYRCITFISVAGPIPFSEILELENSY